MGGGIWRGIVAVVLLGLTSVAGACGDDAGDGSEGAADATEWGAALELGEAASRLTFAVQDERNVAVLGQLGTPPEVAGIEGGNTDDLRRSTDAAVATFRTEAGGAGADATLRPAFDGLGTLADVRARADANAVDAGFDNREGMTEVHQSYTDILATLLDALDEWTGSLDDADLRSGLDLTQRGRRATELTDQLNFNILGSGIILDGSLTAETVADASALATQMQAIEEEVATQASGTPHQAAAEQLATDLTEAGLDIEAVLSSSAPDTSGFPAATSATGRGWEAFITEVEATLSDLAPA